MTKIRRNRTREVVRAVTIVKVYRRPYPHHGNTSSCSRTLIVWKQSLEPRSMDLEALEMARSGRGSMPIRGAIGYFNKSLSIASNIAPTAQLLEPYAQYCLNPGPWPEHQCPSTHAPAQGSVDHGPWIWGGPLMVVWTSRPNIFDGFKADPVSGHYNLQELPF